MPLAFICHGCSYTLMVDSKDCSGDFRSPEKLKRLLFISYVNFYQPLAYMVDAYWGRAWGMKKSHMVSSPSGTKGKFTVRMEHLSKILRAKLDLQSGFGVPCYRISIIQQGKNYIVEISVTHKYWESNRKSGDQGIGPWFKPGLRE